MHLILFQDCCEVCSMASADFKFVSQGGENSLFEEIDDEVSNKVEGR